MGVRIQTLDFRFMKVGRMKRLKVLDNTNDSILRMLLLAISFFAFSTNAYSGSCSNISGTWISPIAKDGSRSYFEISADCSFKEQDIYPEELSGDRHYGLEKHIKHNQSYSSRLDPSPLDQNAFSTVATDSDTDISDLVNDQKAPIFSKWVKSLNFRKDIPLNSALSFEFKVTLEDTLIFSLKSFTLSQALSSWSAPATALNEFIYLSNLPRKYFRVKRKLADHTHLSVPRWAPMSARLADGRVLISGGYDYNHAILSSVELYDPVTGTFTKTGSMKNARAEGSITTLIDGRVLIAGGHQIDASRGKLVYLDKAEIYDPSTGVFEQIESLHVPRSHQFAVLLKDGRVLIAGGGNNSGALKSAELFDPITRKFSLTGEMLCPRASESDYSNVDVQQSGTLLPNGNAMIMGKAECANPVQWFAEIYDAATGIFHTSKPTQDFGNGNSKGIAIAKWTDDRYVIQTRERHLGDGLILYNAKNDTYELIYEPSKHEIYFSSLNVLPDGNVILFAPFNEGIVLNIPSKEIVPIISSTWRHYGSTVTQLLNGDLLILGGETNRGSG